MRLINNGASDRTETLIDRDKNRPGISRSILEIIYIDAVLDDDVL